MSEIDPYINYDARTVSTGEKDRSITLTTGYQLVMRENAGRIGYEFEGAIVAANTISIRYGLTDTPFEIVGGGSHMRDPKTGGVFVGDIYAKSGTGGDKLIAREW